MPLCLVPLFVVVAALCAGVPGWAQNLGQAPAVGAGGRDLSAGYPLPPLRDGPGDAVTAVVAGSQVGQRARRLGLGTPSARDAWRQADASLGRAQQRLEERMPPGGRVFGGERTSALNALLRDPAVRAVVVRSARLTVDEPVRIARPRVWLDLGQAELRAAANAPVFLLRIEKAAGVRVDGGVFAAGRWGVLVADSADVTLRGGRYDGLANGGVVLTRARAAVVGRSRMGRLGGAGVLVHGASRDTVVVDNEIVGNLGASNWNAGIVVTDRNAEVADDPLRLMQPDRYWVREERIDARLNGPRGTVLAYNQVVANASSGIYSDGSVQTVVFQNRIERNAKEGVCLDNGSTASVVAMNTIRQNGQRWGRSDAELRADFVAGAGRLADGTAAAKTPGVSIDNAAYNIVYGNVIDRNFGGGIKMVRSGFYNLVGHNLLTDNNEGASDRFHYFGIELGAAGADAPALELDFLPSRGNLVFGNTIAGSHYAGIFYGRGSSDNDAFDNSIFGATHWALEQAAEQPNATLNNLTNLPSRLIGNGLDPLKTKPLDKAGNR